MFLESFHKVPKMPFTPPKALLKINYMNEVELSALEIQNKRKLREFLGPFYQKVSVHPDPFDGL